MPTERKNISTHTPSEERVGYSRAVVVGNRLYIGGTTSVDEEGTVVGDNVEVQTKFIFSRINTVLKEGGFIPEDIALVRAYITDMDQLPQFDKVFREYFEEIKPACTLLGISQLVDPKLLIEIECIADKGK